jgi:DnaJ-class molecular chaperone
LESGYDIENCLWCRGDGKDHGTLGMAQVRDCPRCEGSGRVYVTNRESVTGRRRVYKGPAPRPGVIATYQQQELTEVLQRPKRHTPRKKDARSHAA